MDEVPLTATSANSRRRAPLMWLGIAVAIGVALWLVLKPDIRSVKGTVVHVDTVARKATLEIKDPRGGNAFEITGTIPPECPITIDGAPAAIGDVRVGDFARVKGELKRDKSVIALQVKVERTTRKDKSAKPAAGTG